MLNMVKNFFALIFITSLKNSIASSIRGGDSRNLKNVCGGMLDESSCLNKACAWCEFKDDIYDPICLKRKDIQSLPPGYFTCNVKKPEQTSQPTRSPIGRDGAPPLSPTAPLSSAPSIMPSPFQSATPSSVPSSPYPTYQPSRAPSPNRDGVPPLIVSPSDQPPAPTSSSACGGMPDESSCLNKACAWCEFKDDIYNPICLRKIDVLSLPTGFYTCNNKQLNETSQPTKSPVGRDGSPSLVTAPPFSSVPSTIPSHVPSETPTSVPSSVPSSPYPSYQPSSTPSSNRNGVPPNSGGNSGDVVSCFDLSDEALCRDMACKWCNFSYDAYAPVCLTESDTFSLPPSLATCT